MRDASRKIARDLACVRCGYNLRGLGHADRCPECNAPVSASTVRQGWLRFVTVAAPLAASDPRWVRSILGGMRWLAASIAIQFIARFVMELKFDPTTGYLVYLMLDAGSWIAFIWGVIHVTRLDPAGRDREVWTLRGVACAHALIGLSLLAPWARLPNVLLLVYGATAFGTTLLLHTHLGQLAQRLPSRALRTVATVGGFALAFTGCVSAVTAPRTSGGPPVFGPLQLVARLALPGGLDAVLGQPTVWIMRLILAALGATPIYFLILWHARPRHVPAADGG